MSILLPLLVCRFLLIDLFLSSSRITKSQSNEVFCEIHFILLQLFQIFSLHSRKFPLLLQPLSVLLHFTVKFCTVLLVQYLLTLAHFFQITLRLFFSPSHLLLESEITQPLLLFSCFQSLCLFSLALQLRIAFLQYVAADLVTLVVHL